MDRRNIIGVVEETRSKLWATRLNKFVNDVCIATDLEDVQVLSLLLFLYDEYGVDPIKLQKEKEPKQNNSNKE